MEIDDISLVASVALDQFSSAPNVCDHFRYKKPKDKRSLPRNYRTRKDSFEKVWNEIQLKLELQPESYAREIIEWLSEKHPANTRIAKSGPSSDELTNGDYANRAIRLK